MCLSAKITKKNLYGRSASVVSKQDVGFFNGDGRTDRASLQDSVTASI